MCMLSRHLVKSSVTPAQALMKSKGRGEMKGVSGRREERGLRIKKKKKKKRRKVKYENVSYLVLEAVSLIYSVSSHTSAFACHFLSRFFSYPLSLYLPHPLQFSPSLPPLYLCHTCNYLPLFLTLSFIPCSLSPAKNF